MNILTHDLPVINRSAEQIITTLMGADRRVLLFGPPGVGKSVLTCEIARALALKNRACCCLNADPGSPAFGIPGTVSLARWAADNWQVSHFEALCSLDAGRFRLPLINELRHLLSSVPDGVLLIDGPGVVRGVAGRELFQGLVAAAGVEIVLALSAENKPLPLVDELLSSGTEVYVVCAAEAARQPGKRARARLRTQQWDAYLDTAVEYRIDLDRIQLLGTPPPVDEPYCWQGRVVALLKANRTVAMAEVLQMDGSRLDLKGSAQPGIFDALLIRDVERSGDGLLETSTPFVRERFEFIPPPDILASVEDSGGPRIVGRVGVVDVALVNGVFGDPLLHLRIRHLGRSLLFDLGDGGRLSARVAHQVTDVFISHAHMDHISGFQWLLRSRLGDFPACRIYGPPGLARHIEGFIQSFLWDRIGEHGPCFEIMELHEERLQRYHLKVGRAGCQQLGENKIDNGILLDEPGFRVRAVLLDHHTPVVAYAFEPDKEIHVRKDRLQAQVLEPGPWLTELKQQLLAERDSAMIRLPNGEMHSVADLAAELTLIRPGKRLVYATDLADNQSNRQRLIAFARNTHTLFCESAFINKDVQHAISNGHLTTSACGEIATAAGVGRLVAFHFSRRYHQEPQQVYDELQESCSRVAVPKSMSVFDISDSAAQEIRFE